MFITLEIFVVEFADCLKIRIKDLSEYKGGPTKVRD